MGIFATRPEDPFEWAGIPSEPARPKTDAELLATVPQTAPVVAPDAPLGATMSIVIPIPATTPAPARPESTEPEPTDP
jgi:hypothetical protein